MLQPKSRRKSSFLLREASHGTPSRHAHKGTASNIRAIRGTRLWSRGTSAASWPATRPKSSPRPEATLNSQPEALTTVPPIRADTTIPTNIATKASNTRRPGVGGESATDTADPIQPDEVDAARRATRVYPLAVQPTIAYSTVGRSDPNPSAVLSDQRGPYTDHGWRASPQHEDHQSTRFVARTRKRVL